jgi:hypothetical protein
MRERRRPSRLMRTRECGDLERMKDDVCGVETLTIEWKNQKVT